MLRILNYIIRGLCSVKDMVDEKFKISTLSFS